MKRLLLCALILTGLNSQAANITCILQELSNGNSQTTEILLTETDDPHGALENLNMTTFTNFNGFVALSNNVIVIHLYNQKTTEAISTQSYGSSQKYARLQYLMPSESIDEAIIIECLEN